MIVATILLLASVPTVAQEDAPEAAFQSGVEAYRRGDYASAETLWRSALEDPLPEAERARLFHNLGNAAFRQDELLEAVAWYTAGVRLAPRDRDLWSNLELARLRAGLEPADRGDLRSTVVRLLDAIAPAERDWLVLGAAGLWALALLGEALRGGVRYRRLSWLGLFAVAVSLVPTLWHLRAQPVDPHMVVADPATSLRSEPRDELAPIGQLEAGAVVERIDALPQWVRVETESGSRGWVPEGALQSLAP